MMRKVLMSLVGIMAVLPLYAVTDCVNETYTITYSCGAGTVNTDAGKTLPDAQIAQYGQNVTIQALCSNDRVRSVKNLTCVAPDGMAWGGYAIYVDGKKVSSHTTNGAFTFKYLFNSDIEIQPNWVGPASLDDLRAATGAAANYLLGWSYQSGGSANMGTWRVYYGFGFIEGDAMCSNYRETDWYDEGSPVFIPIKQDLVPEDEARTEDRWGVNCYCRITNPDTGFNPWVFRSPDWDNSAGCDENCELMCADYISGVERFRNSVLTGLYENGPNE